MENSRSTNVILNSISGMLAIIVSSFMTFLVRTVLSKSLGEEIYGVNTLFSSIITTMLIMELGINVAMTILLYGPVENREIEKIKSIIRFYRNIYRYFCAFFFVIGMIVCIVILPQMVESTLPIIDIQLYFVLFLFSIICKYLWSYKRSLLMANQENRIATGVISVNETIFSILQIAILMVAKSYWIYLLLLILQNFVSNLVCNIIINRKYSYIVSKDVLPLSREIKDRIVSIVKPLFIQRLSGAVQDSSIPLVISFISRNISEVGYFGNYQLVIHMLQLLYSQIGAAFTTSFGNLAASKDKKECFIVFKNSKFVMNYLSIVISSCFLVLIQKFIEICFGFRYVLDIGIVFILTIYVYILLNSVILVSVQNSLGIHILDSKQMVYQTISNIVLSLCFGYMYGVFGAILGTLISFFVYSYLYKGYVIYKFAFERDTIEYCRNIVYESFRFMVVSLSMYLIFSLFDYKPKLLYWIMVSMLAVFVAIILCSVVSSLFKEFDYLKMMFSKKILRRC